MRNFFVPPECIKGDMAIIAGEEAHHILDVLRLKKGRELQLFDGRGNLYQGKILDTQAKQVKVKIECGLKKAPVSNLELTLVVALPKKNKMDYIVEKSTELGVDVIIPTQTARTIVQLDQSRQLARKLRWQRIACAAAKQCRRATIPQVKDLTTWEDALSTLVDFDLQLLLCLMEKTQSLKDVLRGQNKPQRIALFIGPEGDFTAEEIQQARASGCIPVSLGTNVLKSDTACVSALAMINYELKQ